ncbi:hypothetical protein CHS0354_029967 [Potamilus streckersoni]|uniref:Uncharacterized protein n=1 Tax=Potamilus streckersoni TaxID=2493646 RepID=A0AAE0TIZ5_9BIVA|nr:hypothetical protein CHS0354_029967 [Potamilus streckersoni]
MENGTLVDPTCKVEVMMWLMSHHHSSPSHISWKARGVMLLHGRQVIPIPLHSELLDVAQNWHMPTLMLNQSLIKRMLIDAGVLSILADSNKFKARKQDVTVEIKTVNDRLKYLYSMINMFCLSDSTISIMYNISPVSHPYHEFGESLWNPRRRYSGQWRCPEKMTLAVAMILFLGIILMILNMYQLQQMKDEHSKHIQPVDVVEGRSGQHAKTAPTVWIHGKNLESGYLRHVFEVFSRLGYVHGQANWDVLWAHDYPFSAKHLTNLKSHQKVNHFPGSGYITNKVSLATSQSQSIPMAFRIPKDKDKFLKYARDNPGKMWVQKNNNHRGIKILTVDELDLETEGSFVQEYVSKPLLIDGRKFDIGIYTILTSINPLRIYVVKGDILVRFCSQDYHPFDAQVVDKYVVGDDYTPLWKMPSLVDIYVKNGYTFKETFHLYLRQHGKNATKSWSQIYDTIQTIYLEKESLLLSAADKYKTTRNFFEMVRFDFVLDEDMNVFLMEVNMSPNLSSAHFTGNTHLYEHVIFNVLRLVGVARYTENSFIQSERLEADMLVSDRDIQVFPEWCTSKECVENCIPKKCKLCNHCLNLRSKMSLKDAYLEHINRGTCRRVWPPPLTHSEAVKWDHINDPFNLDKYTENNRLMFLWFIGMCREDIAWCS